jgi:hypothetical protein
VRDQEQALSVRVLVALHSPDDVEAMRLGAKYSRETSAELAVCQVRPRHADSRSDLALQRRITNVLRATLGSIAEDVAVFVVGDSLGDDLASVASSWSADVLVRDGNLEPIT